MATLAKCLARLAIHRSLTMHIDFILVEPARAANIGAAARAIKTQGFNQLIIVNSQAHREDEAQWVAHGAQELLTSAKTAPSLFEIHDQYDLLIATTARERGATRRYFTPKQLNEQLNQQQQSVQRAAIVFGREASGLNNEELALCDLWSYTPLAGDYPSLNLAQAVMVYAYELSNLSHQLGYQPASNSSDKTRNQLNALQHRAEQLVDSCAKEDAKIKAWLREGIAQLGDRDIKLAHQLLNGVEAAMKK